VEFHIVASDHHIVNARFRILDAGSIDVDRLPVLLKRRERVRRRRYIAFHPEESFLVFGGLDR
jgi:hypothetical protein